MKREELHDIILGLAVVALGYAIFQHRKTANTINMSDQLAIDTAMGAGAGLSDGPDINVPAPIAVQESGGVYTFDMNTLLQGAI